VSLSAGRADRLAAVRARPAPLFVYGTLLFDEVARVLIGRDPGRQPASVPGWRVAPLIGATYPALVPAADSPAAGGTPAHPGAPGELLTDLTWAERRVIDDYEGPGYGLELLAATAAGPPASARSDRDDRAELPVAEGGQPASARSDREDGAEPLAVEGGRLAWCYVRGPTAPPVAGGAWRRAEFRRDHLASFLARLTGT
jgi:hypothetical protein